MIPSYHPRCHVSTPHSYSWQTLAAARAWAAELADLPQDALAALKLLTHAAGQLSLPETNAYEAQLFNQLWNEPNHREALDAFLEKRPPRFNRPL